VEGEQHAKARCHDYVPHDPLHDVEVRRPIGFDDQGPVWGNGDVPSDQHAVSEGMVGGNRQLAQFWPPRQLQTGDRRITVRVAMNPAKATVRAEITAWSKNAGLEIDSRRDPSGMKIIHDVIVADCHSK